MSSKTAEFLLVLYSVKKVEFGKTLKMLRQGKGMTQAQLAAKLGVVESAVRGWEKESWQTSFEMLYKIAQIFDVTVDQLLGVEEF